MGSLAGELAGPEAAGLTAAGLEELPDERGREVLRQLLQDHCALRAVREEQRAGERPGPVEGTGQVTRTRLEAGHARDLATLFGTVTVTRCAWRYPGAANFCPADAALSLPAGRHSRSLAKLAAIEATRGSFDTAHGGRPPLRPGHRQAADRGVRRERRRRCPRVLRRPGSRARAAPPARRHRPARRPGRARPLRPGPKARGKWLAGSVRKDPAGVITAMSDEAGARDPGHLRTWVVLAGGAEHQLSLIRAEAARRSAAIHVVIDIIHVLEYI